MRGRKRRRTGPGRPVIMAVVALLAAGACDNGEARRPARADRSETGSSRQPADPGRFPSRPDYEIDLRLGARDWELPAGAGEGNDGLTLAVGSNTEVVTAAAPVTVTPGEAGVMVEADVVLPRQKDSGAGVWCRGDAGLDGGYAFVVGREGGWGLFRYRSRAPEQLERGAIDPAQLGGEGPIRLRLACGKPTGGSVTLGVAYGDAPFALVTDTEAPTPTSPTKVGVMATRVPVSAEVAEARVSRVTFRYAKAG